MDREKLTRIALRYRALFLEVNRMDIDMQSELVMLPKMVGKILVNI